MAKNRDKQRENKRKGKEERLNAKNEYGISDPTPKMAVNNIVNARQALSNAR